jgi:hypothetical protein
MSIDRIYKKHRTRKEKFILPLAILVAGVLLIFPATQRTSYAQNGVDQTITQIAQQIASADPNTNEGDVQQTIQQIATQTANSGGDANQAITQVAQQVASNPTGPVTHNRLQLVIQRMLTKR